MASRTVKAVVQLGYGLPADVLTIADVDQPPLGDLDVLVRVVAASVNALDWHTTRGIPKIMRVSDGRSAPRKRIRGIDLAGVVEAVGTAVASFRPGDRVFGGADGSLAERAVTSADRLAMTPESVSHEQASTLCVAGLTALQAVRDYACVEPGQRVVVMGAGGGVGTFAVQLAAWMGAHVTAVTRTEHVQTLQSLGSDEVIDYTREDVARGAGRYDALIVVGGNRSLGDCLRVLRRPGRLVVVGGPTDRLLALGSRVLAGMALRPFTGKRVTAFVAKNRAADLQLLAHLAETGRLRAVISQMYPLIQAPDAIARVGSGCVGGKLVVVPTS